MRLPSWLGGDPSVHTCMRFVRGQPLPRGAARPPCGIRAAWQSCGAVQRDGVLGPDPESGSALVVLSCAGGGIRTRTPLPAGDFKSDNSANTCAVHGATPTRAWLCENQVFALRLSQKALTAPAVRHLLDGPRARPTAKTHRVRFAEDVRRRLLGGHSADHKPNSDLVERNDREHTETVTGQVRQEQGRFHCRSRILTGHFSR